MEECAEIVQVCAKAQRFGLDNVRPGSTEQNLDRLLDEFLDLRVAMSKLRNHVKYDYPIEMPNFQLKSDKFDTYYEVSKNMGMVTE